MRKLTITIISLLFAAMASAIPAVSGSFVLKLESGEQVAVSLCGDEYGHYYIDDAGNKYELTDNGILVPYSEHSAALHSSIRKVRANAASDNTKLLTTFPTFGDVRSVVILVNFTDRKFVSSTARTDFEQMLNEHGYSQNDATGSAQDYYYACSNGQFRPQFDVYGPYDLPHDMAYYGYNVNGVDGNPAEMIVNACSVANGDVNFSTYDLDNDGIIDNVFVYYAGYSEAEGAPSYTIWPHRWSVMPSEIYGSSANINATRQACTFDGKRVYGYACTAELKGNSGNSQCGIGVFCHEFAHVLGLVDLYHTTSSKTRPTLGSWDIMDSGSYSNEGRTPPMFSAFERFVVGWETPHQLLHPETVDLTAPSQDEMHKPDQQQSCVIADGVFNFVPATPTPSEYFILEYRKKVGWDAFLPDEGMLIWHIDFDITSWRKNVINNYSDRAQSYASHMGVYLQHPQGEITTPGAPYKDGDRFVPKLWNSHALAADSITDIKVKDDIMSFNFMGGLYLDLTPPVLDSITHVSHASMMLNWTDWRTKESIDTTKYVYEVLAYYQYNGDTVANYAQTSECSYEILNLQSGYFIDAKVRTIVEMPYYTRATQWSNLLSEATLISEDGKHLPHFVEDGQLYIVKDNADDEILVYDVQGHKVGAVNSRRNAEPISLQTMFHGNVYIFRQGKKFLKWVW